MGFLLSKLLPLLLYPLGLGLLLQLLGLAAASKGREQGSRRRRQASLWLSGTGVGLIWLCAMPLSSRQLIWGLEDRAAALTPRQLPRADAVVVLGGGLRPALPPRQGVEVAEGGDRLLRGVQLVRRAPPLLVTSGGRVSFTGHDPAPPEALWARDLAEELGLPADRILINPGSRTTAEEARDIGALGRRRGWTRVLLITSAFHMPRSLATFQRRSGLTVVPVACDYQLPDRAHYGKPTLGNTLKSLLPDAEALYLSTLALKEHLGLAIYRLRGWS
ncbi:MULTISPECIES: YdcF family protein [Cyanobium]|uniref:YdcF family protein n=1 Tax=Cyanobium usitatum str. Tous TaxID=2116684 RepID=A0A2P7MS72_9CYAN|nr:MULTISPECIES: YdcF family protein [Cyanobium]MCP9780368.1 YdcF family protein [Cyanobium sp. To12R1]PSJ04051.1 YdcF family protein [Cyanobium usitatum str. Tous]